NVKKDLLDLINWIMDDGTSPYNDKLTLSSAYYELSKSHVTLKEFTKALSLIKKTQELNIFSFNTDKILYLKAIINLNLNQNDEALKDFLIVKNNEDLREEVHCYIGECYYKIGKYEKSMSYFIDSLATNKDQYIRFKLGVCYFNTKIYDKAVHFFSEAIDMKPTPAAHYNRALSLLKINDLPKAKEDLVIAARNDIQNSKKLLERIENR
ncbi:MAG: tetratricopeptide (TPR) repeat protein, partial [Cryomorphaceae bacterium]